MEAQRHQLFTCMLHGLFSLLAANLSLYTFCLLSGRYRWVWARACHCCFVFCSDHFVSYLEYSSAYINVILMCLRFDWLLTISFLFI